MALFLTLILLANTATFLPLLRPIWGGRLEMKPPDSILDDGGFCVVGEAKKMKRIAYRPPELAKYSPQSGSTRH